MSLPLNNSGFSYIKYIYIRIFLVILFFSVAACSEKNDSLSSPTIKIAVLPDQNKKQLIQKYQPLLDYLNRSSAIKTELVIPDSYEQLTEWFHEKKVDMAKFGGVTYAEARRKSNAVPFVMRDVDGRFRSVALVRTSSKVKKIEDSKGMTAAFGSQLSTSGHIMPRYFFQKRNIFSDTHFKKIVYSGAHDKTAEWVRDGKVDIGISNSGIVDEMFRSGRLDKKKIKVIWISPPFPDYVWAVQPDMDMDLKITVRNSFLGLSQNRADKTLLKNLGANYYIPAKNEDFKILEAAILSAKNNKLLK